MKRLRAPNIFNISIVVLLVVGALAVALCGNNTLKPYYSGPSVKIKGVEIPVELAKTEVEREKGLSGRASLDPDRGMLFIFDKPARYNFWMPDMHFPIDIIWINNGKVIDISENVSNEFDPENPILYSPSEPVQYVLEVNAGFALSQGVKIGDEVTITETWPSE